MKKLYIVVIAFIMASTLVLASCSCKKKDSNLIRVNEVTHSVFYAPLYVAINKGYFADENLKIDLVNGGGADKSMTALLSGAADIGLMGPEAAIYNVAEGNPDAPKVFGQLTKRDGSFLIGRTASDNFKWSDLSGKEIIAGRRGGAPAMTLEYALNLNGLYNGVNVTLNFDVEFNNMGPAFQGGTGDYVTMFEPAASELVAAGNAHILASVGLAAGEVPFTAFMATESYLTKNKDKATSFLRAIIRGYTYLTTANMDDVIDALAPSFTTLTRDGLRASIQSYKDIDAWVSTPVMAESAYNRLITVMSNAGYLANPVAFQDVVDNTIASQLMLELFG